jgi:YVTN family beta-propeller protein
VGHRSFSTIVLGLALAAPAPAVSSEALTTNQLADSVSIVDLAEMKTIATIETGGGKPAGIALDGEGRFAYVTAPDKKEVLEIDATELMITRRLAIGEGPLGIAAHPANAEIYVADWYAHKILVVETEGFTKVAEVAVGQSPSGLAVTPDGKLLLSADRDSNQVSILDIATRMVVATIATGERPFGITIDAEGRLAYTANVASDDVTVIDIAARKVSATIKVGHRPYAIALSAGHGFATDQGSGTITAFETASHKPVKTIEACDHPEGIEADSATGTIYIACWGDNVLLRLDPLTFAITGKAAVGDGPRAFGKFLR